MAKPRPVLVTHVIPHLDDIAAFWLLVRFNPALKKAQLKFVTTTPEGLKLEPGEIGVGVGRGAYDEHKGDKKESAVSLVWNDLCRRKRLPGGTLGRALAELTDFVKRGDLGEYIGKSGPGFPLADVLRALTKLPGEDSRTETLLGFRLLDATLILHEERIKIDEAIRKGLKFRTKWGRAVAITVDAVPGAISGRIAELGYAMVVLRFPDSGYLHVRCTPGTKADLSRLGRHLMATEPEARWYLHHSKKMLLQGDWVAPVKTRSKQSLADMVALIKKLYA